MTCLLQPEKIVASYPSKRLPYMISSFPDRCRWSLTPSASASASQPASAPRAGRGPWRVCGRLGSPVPKGRVLLKGVLGFIQEF